MGKKEAKEELSEAIAIGERSEDNLDLQDPNVYHTGERPTIPIYI